MSTFKDEFKKLTPDQQAEFLKQAQEIHQPDADAQAWNNLGMMTDNELQAFRIRAQRDGQRNIADREAKRAAEARGFEVTTKKE